MTKVPNILQLSDRLELLLGSRGDSKPINSACKAIHIFDTVVRLHP
jgi:hypothetical protein